MGFPIPYAGVMPRLLFTAAISMASLKDLCISLLESLGITTLGRSHLYITRNESNYNINDSASSIIYDYPSQIYFNPHLHAPADHPLFLRRTAFFEAVRASLPAVLYESLSCKCLVQEWELVNSLGLQGGSVQIERSASSSSTLLMSSSIPSSSSSSLCSADSHVLCSPLVEFEQIDRRRRLDRPSTIPQSELSFPCSCGVTAASSHVDHHLQQCPMAYKLQKQAVAAPSTISANVQKDAAGSSYACNFCLQQRAECAVCLCEFKRGEEVRELPSCSHIFHKDCIDGWLLHNHRTCPLCRSSLLTPAIEMQENMCKQELCDQLSSWFNSLQQDEGAAYQDHYLQHLHLDHHQDFYYSLQPAGN